MPKTRAQDPFYKRINEIEKKAKMLQQKREDQMDQYDVNDFFQQAAEKSKNFKERLPSVPNEIEYSSNIKYMSQFVNNAGY